MASEISGTSDIRGCWRPRKHCYLLYGSHIALQKHLRRHFQASWGSNSRFRNTFGPISRPLQAQSGASRAPSRPHRSLCRLIRGCWLARKHRYLLYGSRIAPQKHLRRHFEASLGSNWRFRGFSKLKLVFQGPFKATLKPLPIGLNWLLQNRFGTSTRFEDALYALCARQACSKAMLLL